MASFLRCFLALAACLLCAQASQLREQAAANPVRKVVQLLQKMQKQVEAEGEKEEDLYKKFSCYCKTGVKELEARVEAAGNKSPQLQADIKAGEEKLTQTKADLKDAQKERSDAKAAVAAATSIREKDSKAHADLKAELEGYISQIKSAVAALEKGMAGSFLQSTASAIKRIVEKSEVNDDDKETVLSFLSGKVSYVPKSGEITGILKEMMDSFAANLKEAEDSEAQAISDFEALVAAKGKEVDTLTGSIEAKLEQIGELGTSVVQMKVDLEDVAGSLYEDKKMLADLTEGCTTKDAEYAERVKTRNEELQAIAETIKILNDDDALELFKKTLPAPSASLMQLKVSAADMRTHALQMIEKVSDPSSRSRLNFLVLALRGRKIGFEKVIAMIDEMVAVLKKEGQDDSYKKEYCSSMFDSSEDKKKELQLSLSDTETAIASSEEKIAALAQEIAETEASIKELDKSVREATQIRKEENEEFKALVQSDTAAKKLLLFAKNRLNQFYNPKLYNPPAKKELSEMGAIDRDMSLVQISQHMQLSKLAPEPETWDAYAKKTEESTGVISMIDLLVKDLDTEMTEAKTEETNSQEEYDKTIADAKADRVGLSKSLKEKTAAKADLTSDLETLKSTKKSVAIELMATDKFIGELHAECDWLLKYFDVRAEARAGEIDALGKAKSVLSGADYSFVQRRILRSRQ